MVSSLLAGLKQAKLAAQPSSFYRIKRSILLSILSLISTYTIILLQAKSGNVLKETFNLQNNTCACI